MWSYCGDVTAVWVFFTVAGEVAYCIYLSIYCHFCNWNAVERGAVLVSEAGSCRLLLLRLVLPELVSIFATFTRIRSFSLCSRYIPVHTYIHAYMRVI